MADDAVPLGVKSATMTWLDDAENTTVQVDADGRMANARNVQRQKAAKARTFSVKALLIDPLEKADESVSVQAEVTASRRGTTDPLRSPELHPLRTAQRLYVPFILSPGAVSQSDIIDNLSPRMSARLNNPVAPDFLSPGSRALAV
eukprot:CAMPEP_0183338326 /NCGR_PEP_ID=MMETSP0164_2-20130417/5658_1 /TAXON_ID=221442 /ORGANISM="Coccolithus pelagicus ssp braarudi, Strain PLY182g" /LENGTH=145 /DNA_ID=CAMNT_0025508159 /DNA_START=35 /DNA_END=472 /DNA_ORIENTATION=+